MMKYLLLVFCYVVVFANSYSVHYYTTSLIFPLACSAINFYILVLAFCDFTLNKLLSQQFLVQLQHTKSLKEFHGGKA